LLVAQVLRPVAAAPNLAAELLGNRKKNGADWKSAPRKSLDVKDGS